jgi:cysteine synthase A
MIFTQTEEIINNEIFLKVREFAYGNDVYLKLEGFNPGGSIKAKTALALVRDAEEHRDLRRTRRYIESSSGNLGAALSVIAADRNYKFICVTDKNTSEQNIQMMRALGTEVVIIDQRDAQGGYLANRLKYIREKLEEDPGLIWLNQYQNQANPAIHAELTASAILKQFGRVDYLFVGAGTTGTLMGVTRHFRAHSPKTKIIAVDSVGSITFGGPGQKRYLSGLGASVMPHFFDAAQIDRLISIPEAETIANCRDVARRFGYMGGASTGTVLAGIRRMEAEIDDDAVVVGISPDLGNFYLNTVYDDEWCDRTYGDSWRFLPPETHATTRGVVYA